jgi:hypothetical protein
MAMADSRGDGTVDIEELSQALCPPKKWTRQLSLSV